jgi:hypothetical protein
MKAFGADRLRATGAAGIFVIISAGAAHDDCFELIGCSDSDYFRTSDLRQLSCENLWYVRNRIYDENGYCFRTWRAQQAFDNSDCSVNEQEAVSLNHYERTNVSRIVSVESNEGCN